MTTPLKEDEVWIYKCNADDDEYLCCHVSDPNAFCYQRCRKCPSGIKTRIKKTDKVLEQLVPSVRERVLS